MIVLYIHQSSCRDISYNSATPSGSRIPALSTDEVSASSPVDAVASTSAVGVSDLGATIGPP